jgi:hypothetical protein
MEIVIVLDAVEPPAGHIRRDPGDGAGPGPPVPFAGWLGLLRVLEKLIQPAAPDHGQSSSDMA